MKQLRTLFLLLSLVLLFTGCVKKSGESESPLAPPPPASPKTEAPARETLSPAYRLRKLSFHLRGISPSETDYEALAGAKNLDIFFATTTNDYLKSPEHIGKMIDRVDSLFRLRISAGLPETRLLPGKETTNPFDLPGSETLNSLDLLVESIAKTNLNWDKLVTSKFYWVPLFERGTDFFSLIPEDYGFFNAVAPNLPPSSRGIIRQLKPVGLPKKPTFVPVEFDAADPRIAGAITTHRFISRFSTTNVNKNRGRAAALFRIFLCDDMRAVVDTKAEEENDLLKQAFPKPTRFSHRGLSDDEKQHGSDAACLSCHYKLDPLGKTFMTTGTALSEEAAPGALVYNRAGRAQLNLPGKGIGELADYLVQQPEYAVCQVSHFWKWFIRGDKPPSNKRMAELVAAFNQRGRKTNDFIAYLVNQPEFYAQDNAAPLNLLNVRPIFARCDSCHSGKPQNVIPIFSKFPIGSKAEEHGYWLRKISDALDLEHQGLEKTMPPKSSVWQPTLDDISLIKRWMEEGAKDENGKATKN